MRRAIDEPAMTYDEVGAVLGLTGEGVRKIEIRALARLRRNRTLRELWRVEYDEPRPLNGYDGNTWRRARL